MVEREAKRSGLPIALVALVAAGALGIGAPGCAVDDVGSQTDDVRERNGAGYRVSLGEEYELCLAPVDVDPETQKAVDHAFANMPLPNLQSIRFLAHASSVAYQEPDEMGPELERLGFGAPGDGAWLQACAQDIATLEASSAENPFSEPGLSRCALDWYASSGETGTKDNFIRHAHGTVHPERMIEFFSAEYEVGVDEEYLRGSTQLLWAEHPTEPFVVVAFRGTEFPDADDLWTDGNFPKEPFHFGRVHGGFSDALDSVRELLDERLATVDRDVQIWVTGHSLGGALASLFTAELLHRVDQGANLRVAGMATFGSPRVGDDTFFAATEALAAEQRVPLHRVANVSTRILGFDPITHVPFRNTFGTDFGHVGAPLQINEKGYIDYALEPNRFLAPFGFLEEAIDYVKGKAAEVLSDAFPHALSQYQSRLDQAIASKRHEALDQCGPRP